MLRNRWLRRLIREALSWRGRVWLTTVLVAIVPALVVTLIITAWQAREMVRFRVDQLNHAVEDVAREAEGELAKHRKLTTTLAAQLADQDFTNPRVAEEWILRLAPWAPELESVAVTDAEGRIVAISRLNEAGDAHEPAPFRGKSVADRDYFREAMASGRPYLSPVFVSRGAHAGDAAYVVSAPVLRDGRAFGVVFGSKRAAKLREPDRRFAEGLEASIVILDKRKNVLYASDGLGLRALTPLASVPWLEKLVAAPNGRSNAPAGLFGGDEVLHAVSKAPSGWTIAMLRPQRALATTIGRALSAAAPALLLTLLLAGLLAHHLSLSIMRPLARVLQRIESFSIDGSQSHFRGIGPLPEEYLRMVRRLHRMAWRLHGWQQRLRDALADAKRARSEVISVLVSREDEVRARTKELAAANAALERLSRVDPLTGIANRRWFAEALEREWRACLRDREPITVILIDIDHYKAYNDLYGHQAGDECLSRVAQILAGSLHRPHDLLARYGGEEFAAVVTEVDADRAMLLAERLRLAVQSLGVPHKGGGSSGVLTASVGVATVVPDPAMSQELPLRLADRALYAAKDAGRNRIAAMTPAGVVSMIESGEHRVAAPAQALA
jgi:diguanylate cyclase (GGDEF)-like protein